MEREALSVKNWWRVVASAALIFLISLVVSFLIQQDTRFEAGRVQSTVVEGYRMFARFVVEDGVFSLFDPQARVAHLDLMGHPPGYSLLLSIVFHLHGESDIAIQAVSMFFNSLSAVVLFLIAYALFSYRIATVAGLLAVFCPQFAFNSVLFLPDTLAIFPLLLAVLFFIYAYHRQQLVLILASALCLGLSCWLRANALLMPVFFILAILILFKGKSRLVYAAGFVTVFILAVIPITIRNAVVYKTFIPISLGAGQTLLEGIGDYDHDNSLGVPRTDVGITRLEAEKYNRPDYAGSLFGVDGIERDRMRLAEGLKVIGENPLWFGGVMIQRALWMTKLERVLLVSAEIPATRSALENSEAVAFWEKAGLEVSRNGSLHSKGAEILSSDDDRFILQTDDSKYGLQFSSEAIEVQSNVEYIAEIALRLKKGRIAVKVVGSKSNVIYAFSIIDFEEWDNALDPPQKIAKLPFVVTRDEDIRLHIYNEAPQTPGSLVEIERIRLIELGKASFVWAKPIRFLVRTIQKLFVTGVMLPLAVFGLIILLVRKKRDFAIILMIVPAYYFCVQSALHTEHRYVMAIHYFFFVFAAVSIVVFGEWAGTRIRKMIPDRN